MQVDTSVREIVSTTIVFSSADASCSVLWDDVLVYVTDADIVIVGEGSPVRISTDFY